jgi:hypothetical protein
VSQSRGKKHKEKYGEEPHDKEREIGEGMRGFQEQKREEFDNNIRTDKIQGAKIPGSA